MLYSRPGPFLLSTLLSLFIISCNLEKTSFVLERYPETIDQNTIAFDNNTFEAITDHKQMTVIETQAILDNIQTINHLPGIIQNNEIAAKVPYINVSAVQMNSDAILNNSEAIKPIKHRTDKFSYLNIALIILAVLFIIPWIILCLYAILNRGQLQELKKKNLEPTNKSRIPRNTKKENNKDKQAY